MLRAAHGRFDPDGNGFVIVARATDLPWPLNVSLPARELSTWGQHLDITVAGHHDDCVRTTLTLDRDVADSLKKEMRRTGRGLKATVNEALRRGLNLAGKPPRPPRFEVRPHAFGVRPGIDLDRINQLVDELEADEAARKLTP